MNIPNSPLKMEAAPKSRTFYETVMQRIGWQLEDSTVIDQKVGVWFQSAPVVTTLILGLLLAAKDGINLGAIIVAGIGLFIFAVAMLMLFIAQRPVEIVQGTNWQEIADAVNDDTLPESEFHYWLAINLARGALVQNRQIVKRKAERFNRAVVCFTISTILLLLAALIALPGAA